MTGASLVVSRREPWLSYSTKQKVKAVKPLRLALYSHDTVGLGHARRNLLIAQSFAKANVPVSILLIGGMNEATHFATPSYVDYLTLTSLHKNQSGIYSAKSLELSLEEISKLRSNVIWRALKIFKPDVFVVDNVPRGANNELKRSLKKLRKRGNTKVVLGLRDILDEADKTKQEWAHLGNERVIERYFDAVWVYGDVNVFNPVTEYQFSPRVANKVRHLGYFDQRVRLEHTAKTRLELPETPFVLCQVGGGQDGAKLAEAFVQSTFPQGHVGVLITGPFMPAETKALVRRCAATQADLIVHEFLSEPTQLLQATSKVIAMGGYNTVYEALSFEKPLLVVPRVEPRQEQLLRAERWQAQGVLEYLHPNDLSPETLTVWLHKENTVPYQVHQRFNFRALENLQREMLALTKEVGRAAA
jgi:predicted glycosyltransferase